MRFYLGTHRGGWLSRLDVPLFVSHRTLARYKTLPVARTRWALDSGGFTELSTYGEWRTTPDEYVTAVRRYADQVGRLDWAAPQDWMCEPAILALTRLTVADHQARTVDNYLRLRDTGLPFIPVLQGWRADDYLRHVDDYARAGVDLTCQPTVGIGSVCRRQSSAEIAGIVGRVADLGIRLHGFGVKMAGLNAYAARLASADSMAWSYGGRREPDPACPKRSCANCAHFALFWRARLLSDLRYQQLVFGAA